MANNKELQLSGNMTGLSESETFTMDEDGKVDVVYDTDRCTAAWLEVEESEGVKRKVSILPTRSNGSNPSFKKDTKFKLIAALGRGGFFRAHIYY